MNPHRPFKLDRRRFMQLAAATTVSSPLFAQSATTAQFSLTRKPLATMPLDFNGLSYESPQLANPTFFSTENTGLVKLVRELSPQGVLRLGGNLSAFTAWRDDPSIPITATEQANLNLGKKYWEWDLCDPTIAKGNHEAVFTPAMIQPLADFLKATGWKLLYGLNFGTATPDQAAAEAACVQRLVGSNLLAFQLGNEIDFWNGGRRAKGWDFETYYAEWLQWTKIIRSKVPNAPFAGPDVAIRLDWMEKLAERQGKDLAVLTKHHYAMGPAGNPSMNATHLLGSDPDVAKEIASAQRAKAFAGVGFRTAECGSCFHGGQPGVSDAFAGALWAADYMLTLAKGGHAGINMHGGGDGFYSPIVGDPQRGITPRPLYFGMKFAQAFAGSTIVESSINTATNLTAYAAERANEHLIALINKDSVATTINLSKATLGSARMREVKRLSAPAIDSKTGVAFEVIDPNTITSSKKTDSLRLAPYTAVLLRYS